MCRYRVFRRVALCWVSPVNRLLLFGHLRSQASIPFRFHPSCVNLFYVLCVIFIENVFSSQKPIARIEFRNFYSWRGRYEARTWGGVSGSASELELCAAPEAGESARGCLLTLAEVRACPTAGQTPAETTHCGFVGDAMRH